MWSKFSQLDVAKNKKISRQLANQNVHFLSVDAIIILLIDFGDRVCSLPVSML
jgi:hypothetical protein